MQAHEWTYSNGRIAWVLCNTISTLLLQFSDSFVNLALESA